MQNKIVYFLTQWKTIIPLSIIVLVWFFWPQTNPEKNIKTNISQTKAVSAGQSKEEVSAISLFGTKKKLHCAIESATASIDDTKFEATITENKKQIRVIFDGDCLYRWATGSGGGERSCGLKSYIPLLSGFVSNSSLQKVFPKTNELASACKEASEVDPKVFAIPTNVLFKNKKLF